MSNQAATCEQKQTFPLCNRPVMTHLSIEEFEALERAAKKNLRSLSSTVRLLVIEGLKQE